MFKRVIFALLSVQLFAASAAENPLRRFAFNQPGMGTTFRIVLFAPGEAAATDVARAAFACIDNLDAMMTDYNETSELMRLCAAAGGPPVKVSAELFEVLANAVEINTRTRGAFDVTVGPVVRLWRAARKADRLPDPAELAAAQQLVGCDKMLLNKEERTVQLLKAGMKLDLGGIAKGYAVDRALDVLKQQGFSMALVAGGGDIGVGDPPPGKEGWTVEIQSLDSAHQPKPAQLLLAHAGVSTSGDAEQHLDKGGRRYSHIVDPKTGKAIEGRGSVTIVAPNCTTSDGLAKVGVLGVDAALSVIDTLPHCAALIMIEEKDAIHQHPSKGWKDVPKAKMDQRPTVEAE